MGTIAGFIATSLPRVPLRWLLPPVLYLALAAAFTHPLLLSAADHIPIKPQGDQLWQASILEYSFRNLMSDPGRILAGSFYYGAGNALFGSDLLFGLLLVFAPLRLISGNPLLAFNLTWIVSFALNALAMYAAALRLTGSRAAALVAGTVFAFAPLQVNFGTYHVQLNAAWWIPLVLYFSFKLGQGGSLLNLLLAVVCAWLQFITAAHLGLIAAIALLVFGVLPALWTCALQRDFVRLLKILLVVVVGGAPFVPVVSGYAKYSRDWNALRDITEVQTGSAQITDYLSPSVRLRWHGPLEVRFPVPSNERRLFPGAAPLALALGGAVAGVARGARRHRRVTISALGLACAAVLLSLGTHWKWGGTVTDVELPYLFLFERVPGFASVRVAARYSLLLHVSIALLGAIAVARVSVILDRVRFAAPSLGSIVAAAVIVEGLPRPVNVYEVRTDVHLRALVASAPEGPTLFVPVSGDDEIWRLWQATNAGAGPLVNGYSGFVWPQYWYFRDATRDLTRIGARPLVQALRAFGVRNVLLDRRMLGKDENLRWDELGRLPDVDSVRTAGPWKILSFPAEPPRIEKSWESLSADVLLEEAPADAGLVTFLSLVNPGADPWLPEGGSQYRRATVSWLQAGGAAVLSFEAPYLPPPFLVAGDVYSNRIHLFTPHLPGAYTLRIEIDGARLVEKAVVVGTIAKGSPVEALGALSAGLRLRTPDRYFGFPGDSFPLHVDAVNRGKEAWSGDQLIRLGWRWYRELPGGIEQELPDFEGRIPLLGHESGPVSPGNGYPFDGLLRAPPEPGEYLVLVAMVAENVAWFEDLPVSLRVTLTPRK